jgi:hypothetical protein
VVEKSKTSNDDLTNQVEKGLLLQADLAKDIKMDHEQSFECLVNLETQMHSSNRALQAIPSQLVDIR